MNGLKQIGTICFAFLFSMFSTNLFATDPNIAADATTANCDNATLETYSGTSNLQANWTPNLISLSWYNENTKMTVQDAATTCNYDGSLIVPSTVPTRTGYTFDGWTVRLPGAYTELQYIQASGTQYIDTGIKLSNTDIVEAEFKNSTSSEYGALYGVYQVGESSAFYANQTYYGYDVSNNKINTNVSVNTNWHSVVHNFVEGTLKVDAVVVNFDAFTFVNGVNNYLFARYYNGSYGYPFKGAVRKYRIVRNGSTVLNLIPARRKNDNVVGMYDTVSRTFLTNSVTGTFTAGPVVQ